MSNENDPMSNPNWHAIKRETILAQGLLGSGVTALGKARYADDMGHYYIAFFGLSTGIERLAKLILVADHIIQNDGALPDKKTMELYKKKYGHNLIKLLDKVDEIAKEHKLELEYERPQDSISIAITSCLDSFANGGRYGNLDFLSSSNMDNKLEPINKWWREVAELILKEHYYGKKNQNKVQNKAALISACWGESVCVYHTNETFGAMDDVITSSERTGQAEIVQKYGRFHTLTIVRWMANVFHRFSMDKGYDRRFTTLFGHYEFFITFRQPDRSLKEKKRWP